MEILGSRRACSEFGVRRSLFAGSQFAVRRFSELRIPNSEPRTLLFAGWPDTGVRRSQVRYSQFAVRRVVEYRSSTVRRFTEHRIPNSEPSAFRLTDSAVRRFAIRCSRGVLPGFGLCWPARIPNSELRTSPFPLPPHFKARTGSATRRSGGRPVRFPGTTLSANLQNGYSPSPVPVPAIGAFVPTPLA